MTMIEQVLFYADKADTIGDLFTEQALRDMAAKDPERLRYDENRKALIGQLKKPPELEPDFHFYIFDVPVNVGGKNRIAMLKELASPYAEFKFVGDGRTFMCRKSDVPALRSETETAIKCTILK